MYTYVYMLKLMYTFKNMLECLRGCRRHICQASASTSFWGLYSAVSTMTLERLRRLRMY